jgi:hypothetical protein
MAELIHEHHTHIRTPQGLTFVPRTYAERNADGVWEAVQTWASGLETVYFEGAFARAHVRGERG